MEIEMHDGSVYELSAKWKEALIQKYGDNLNEVLEAFKDEVEDHFNARTVPDKYGYNHDWEETNDLVYEEKEDYIAHADLAHSVLYPVVRAPLMAMPMKEISDQDISVIGLNDEGATEYKGDKKKKYDSVEEALDNDSSGQ